MTIEGWVLSQTVVVVEESGTGRAPREREVLARGLERFWPSREEVTLKTFVL